MTIIQKINRKIKKIYYDRKIAIRQRVNFDYEKYYQDIENENKNCFDKPIFLLSYDDTSMMRKTKDTFEYGGNFESELNKFFFNFVDKYPYLKHTLFFVPNPIFIKEGLTSKTLKKDIFNIDNFTLEDKFLYKLKELEKQKVVEISLHGYNHINTKIKDYYSAFEFEFLDSFEAKQKIQKGLDSLDKFFYVEGFKPPAWSMGQLSGSYYLKNVLREFNFNYVCLSSPTNGLNYEKKKVSYIYPEITEGLFNIPQNISILWDLEYIYKLIDVIVEKKGIINVQLHYTPTHILLQDGICKKNIEKLNKIIKYLKRYEIDYLLHKEVKEKCKK